LLLEALVGLIAGGLVLLLITIGKKVFKREAQKA